MAAISKTAKPNCHIDVGTVIDEEWGGRLMVALLAAESWGAPAAADRPGSRERGGTPADAATEAPGAKKKAPRQLQTNLRFDTGSKGKFKDVEPTILDGEDLDIPTFIRRGIQIER